MSLPDQTPRLPKWIFLTGDAALLGLAYWVARSQGGHPLEGYPLLAVVICVALAGLLGVIPFLTDYAWTQDKALDERQRSLEALSRTTATAAEQISIAAAGLHEIADLAQKNLKQAESLPQKLQEKIADFKVTTAVTKSDEIEELEREINTLRASESDKLEASAEKLAKAVAEFAKAEDKIQKQLTQAGSSWEKNAKAQTEALSEAKVAAVAAIEAAVAKAVAAIETARPVSASAPAEEPKPEPKVTPPSLRESVREVELDPLPVSADTPAEPEPGAYVPEPPPIAITPQAEVAPVAPATPSPFPAEITPEPAPITMAAIEPTLAVSPEPLSEPVTEASSEPPGEPVADEPPSIAVVKTPRKKAPKKVEEPPSLGLDEAGEFSQVEPEAPASQEASDVAISSDGATRILVTAYIGIGNRLFVRGDGPGLSWDKGIALQFVSIGKWRWETSDATATIKFRLFKNDSEECAGLGEKSVEPGQQIQLSASF